MTIAPAAPASNSRWKMYLAIALVVIAVGVFAWQFTRTNEPPAVPAKLEDQSTKLKQELLLMEQNQPKEAEPEPETPVEPTRAARPIK